MKGEKGRSSSSDAMILGDLSSVVEFSGTLMGFDDYVSECCFSPTVRTLC